MLRFESLHAARALGRTDLMILAKAIFVLCFAALFAQSGDMPPTPVAKKTDEFAAKRAAKGKLVRKFPSLQTCSPNMNTKMANSPSPMSLAS